MINQRAKQSHELSAKMTHTIEDLESRWPALNEFEFPEYPLFLINFLSRCTVFFSRCCSFMKP
jgi:hypothetical protein